MVLQAGLNSCIVDLSDCLASGLSTSLALIVRRTITKKIFFAEIALVEDDRIQGEDENMATDIEEIYRQQLKPLSTEERLRLIAMLAQDLAPEAPPIKRERSILELHGLGKEIWEGIDAQEYVNSLREEWDHRP
ncbi:MAG: hypothetical protein KIT57_09380 [Blastocatellales bacterium]|nr:hypothetical protein [Blastocatellales bacterium]